MNRGSEPADGSRPVRTQRPVPNVGVRERTASFALGLFSISSLNNPSDACALRQTTLYFSSTLSDVLSFTSKFLDAGSEQQFAIVVETRKAGQ